VLRSVRKWIGGIAKLVHIKAARNFLGQTGGNVLIIFRMTARNVRARHDYFGPERFDVPDFSCDILSGITRMNAITFRARDQGEAKGAGIGRPVASITTPPACSFPSPARGRLDHGQRDTVLNRSGRILIFEL